MDVPLGRGDGGEVEVEAFGDAGAVSGEDGDGFGVFAGEEGVAWLGGSGGGVLVGKPLCELRCVCRRGDDALGQGILLGRGAVWVSSGWLYDGGHEVRSYFIFADQGDLVWFRWVAAEIAD